MPSSVTHNYFSSDVFNKLSHKIKGKLLPCLNEYKVFSQGPDPYFFYNFHLTKSGEKAYMLNDAMQHSKINLHFLSLINYISINNYYSNSMVMAYLYGQICHFVLDTTCHPFIIYYTGIYNQNDENTYKYNGLHEEMEYFIDCYLIYKRENILPKNYKTYKKIFCDFKFNNELIDVIDTVSFNVYNVDNTSKIYYKSIMDMKKFYYIFNYDKYGIKKILYNIMDKFCGNKFVKKKELSFHVNPNSKLYYLNMNKNIWYHPCVKDEKYNYSFFELYDIAVKKATTIILEIDKMLENKNIDEERIKELFNNLNYGTGKNCDLNFEYKYFKF